MAKVVVYHPISDSNRWYWLQCLERLAKKRWEAAAVSPPTHQSWFEMSANQISLSDTYALTRECMRLHKRLEQYQNKARKIRSARL